MYWADKKRPAVSLAVAAMYVTGAMLLSFVESFLPPLPVPGAKLGLGNLALLLAFCHMGPRWGTAVAFVRWFLMGLLFGSGTSMLFSLAGVCCTVAMLWILRLVPWGHRMSFVGLSVLAATAHNLGQLCCGAWLYGWGISILSMYGGWLVLLGTGCGLVTGFICNLLMARLGWIFRSIPPHIL